MGAASRGREGYLLLDVGPPSGSGNPAENLNGGGVSAPRDSRQRVARVARERGAAAGPAWAWETGGAGELLRLQQRSLPRPHQKPSSPCPCPYSVVRASYGYLGAAFREVHCGGELCLAISPYIILCQHGVEALLWVFGPWQTGCATADRSEKAGDDVWRRGRGFVVEERIGEQLLAGGDSCHRPASSGAPVHIAT